MHASEESRYLIALRLQWGSLVVGTLGVGGVQGRIRLLQVFFCPLFLLECMFDARTCDLIVLSVKRHI